MRCKPHQDCFAAFDLSRKHLCFATAATDGDLPLFHVMCIVSNFK